MRLQALNIMQVLQITISGYAVLGDFIVIQQCNISQGQYLLFTGEFPVMRYLTLYAIQHFRSYVSHGHYL